LYIGAWLSPRPRVRPFFFTPIRFGWLWARTFFLKGDRLTAAKFIGLVLAFGGVVAVFQARSPELPRLYWVGDLMELSAAIFWAATTLYIKRISENISLDHFQTLFAQLIYSFPVLALGSVLFELPVDFGFG
jgi:drug/metabolite transporter (DMT)-like permease